MEFTNILAEAEQNAPKAINEGDYQLDGLWYCGKCNTPKQVRVTICGFERTPFCLCKCAAEALRIYEERKADEARQERIKEKREKAFSSPTLFDCTFANDNGRNAELLKICLNYVSHFDEFIKSGRTENGLLLYGNIGGGKTYAAYSIANALIDRDIPVLTSTAASIVKAFNLHDGTLTNLSRYKLLVIDDLGAERTSEYMQEGLFEVINFRCETKLPVIITTNLSMKELKSQENTNLRRIYERVFAMCYPVEVAQCNQRRNTIREEHKTMKEILEGRE